MKTAFSGKTNKYINIISILTKKTMQPQKFIKTKLYIKFIYTSPQ